MFHHFPYSNVSLVKGSMGDKNWLCCIRNRSTASQVWGDINPSRLGQFLVVSESTMKMRQMLGIFVNSVIFLDGRQETHLENKKKNIRNPSKNSENIWKPIQKFRNHLETHPKIPKPSGNLSKTQKKRSARLSRPGAVPSPDHHGHGCVAQWCQLG